MTLPLTVDEDLLHRLPLPLAQLYRRAQNAKTALERHLTAYYLWEAALKLLASVAVVEYAERGATDPALAERLQNLARPSLGHWWEFVRLLLPVLADGDTGFQKVRDVVLGRTRDDLPRLAGLDAELRRALEGKGGARSTVRLSELFERLVLYRNRELGHGAAGRRPDAFTAGMAQALTAGVAELLSKFDVLAGRRLLYVSDIRRQASGTWLVERFELQGEAARRIESLELPESETAALPRPDRVCLESPPPEGGPALRALHPLVVYDAEAGEALFLNARRGRRRTEYLSYTTGRVLDRQDLGAEHRALLAWVLGGPVDDQQAEQWTTRLQAEEQTTAPGEESPAGGPARSVGEFELLSELGRGGMGVVYRAWQPSLSRQVALKCLFQTSDPKAEARFRREIRALGRVEHPHLVKIFTSGSEGERWFYAMELLEGASLAAVCDRLQATTPRAGEVDLRTWQTVLNTVCEEALKAEKPVSGTAPTGCSPAFPRTEPPTAPPQALPLAGRHHVRHVTELVRQVAEAAHALHEGGIVHRDIKPGNIMVSADGAQAVLMDLGLAQLADEVEGRLTRTRQFVGTLRYASPEQVLAAGNLDRRSDVYSLGATLWELLTLRPMFNATDRTPTPELMQRIQFEEPGRLRKQHPWVPRDLEAIVQKCLEKNPARRYATAQELADELRRFLAGEPVQARPVNELHRVWRWCRRNPAVATLLTTLVCVGVAGFVGVALKWREAETARQEATLRASAEADARRQVEVTLYSNRIALAERELTTGNFGRARDLLAECPGDQRHWEWDYLNRLCHLRLKHYRGHLATVRCAAFSPDGKTLVTASLDKTAKVWDAATGEELLTFNGHRQAVRGVAFSPDGRRVASTSYDQTVKLWDPATGREFFTLRGHTAMTAGVAFSPDGRKVASTSYDNLVKVWDAITGQELLTFRGHTDCVDCVAFSPDGRLAVSGGHDRAVRVWDADTGEERACLQGHTSAVAWVTCSPDGRRIASASWDRTVRLWNVQTGREALGPLRGHTNQVMGVAFSPDGRRLASASYDRTVRLWDAETGQPLRPPLEGHSGYVYHIAFSPDGKRLASSGVGKAQKGETRFWEAETGRPGLTLEQQTGPEPNDGPDQDPLTLRGHKGIARRVAFSPDGRRLASGGQDGVIYIWDVATGRQIHCLCGHRDWVCALAFSPDGRGLVSGSRDQTLILWDAERGTKIHTFPGHNDTIWDAAFTADGRRIVSSGQDGTIRFWDADTRQELPPLAQHASAIRAMALSRDGRRLVSANWDRTINVWNVETGADALSFKGHPAGIFGLAFSPDSQWFASASQDQTIRLWDTDSGQLLRTLDGHLSSVASVAVSPDGQRLASGSWDGTAKVWDPAGGKEVLSLAGDGMVFDVAFSGDGRRLAAACEYGSVRIWDATPLPATGEGSVLGPR
jgi:WD40 repeat protein/serine/threonine protein kinase